MKRFLLIAIVLFSNIAFSQGYFSVADEEFGKNRIQVRKLEWKTIASNNFEFNYYRGGDELAQKAAKIAEAEYRKITETLGYTPFTTMKIFLYKNPRQLSESNIGLTSPIAYDGGILNLSRSRIEIAYDGDDEEFKKNLIREISGLFVYDMLYGGSLKEVLQSSLLLTVPEWYMQGISNYIANDQNDPAHLAELKEAIIRNSNSKIGQLKGKDAALIGESIWYYIAKRYGEDNISNILNLTRIIRAEQSSITSTLGVSFNRFLKEWQSFYATGGLDLEKKEEVTSDPSKAEIPTLETPKLTGLKDGQIDTEHYTFDEVNVLKSVSETKSIIKESSSTFNTSKLNRSKEKLAISSPKAYQNVLINNELHTEILNDPVRRFGVKAGMTLNDLLENHVFDFSVFLSPNISNHDITASYKNYEKRIDWGIKFERRAISLENIDARNHYLFRPLNVILKEDFSFQIDRKVYLHRVTGTIAYPISKNLRFQLNPSIFINSDYDLENLSRNTLTDTYLGTQAQAIYDNTVATNSNQVFGTKANISFERNINFGNSLSNFDRINIDARHYQKVVSGVTLAARFNYGKSMGNSPKYTFLGGVENWLNRSIQPTLGDNPGVPSDLRNIVFYNFAGNLRGFDFAKLYGTNHLLWNLELRFGIANYFPNNAISSSFVRNLQLVVFNDIGTAWNGNKGPFSRQNSLNTDIIGGGGNPFFAEVTNFKNPFLVGYGAGIRTSLLGFLIKADYGFGLEDKEVSSGKLYISVGRDF